MHRYIYLHWWIVGTYLSKARILQVIFAGHIFTNTMYSDYNINGINVTEIASDVLLKECSEKQVSTYSGIIYVES